MMESCNNFGAENIGPLGAWTLTIRFISTSGFLSSGIINIIAPLPPSVLSLLTGPLLRFQVSVDGKTVGEFKLGDTTQVNANADIMDLEVSLKGVTGRKKTLKLILRPKPPGNPEIDILLGGWLGYPSAMGCNVDILEQKNC